MWGYRHLSRAVCNVLKCYKCASGTEPTCIGHCDVPSPKGCAICSPAPQPEWDPRFGTKPVPLHGESQNAQPEPEDALADELQKIADMAGDDVLRTRLADPRTVGHD